MFCVLIFLILTLIAVEVSSPVTAFVPTDRLGKLVSEDGTHESITKDVIGEMVKNKFSFAELPRTAVKAMNTIAEANADQDDKPNDRISSIHFDGESFESGQIRILGLRQSILDALKKNEGEVARTKLGAALHTIQDFYSHSNWIELGKKDLNLALGQPGQMIGNTAIGEDTCKNCTSLSPCPDCSNILITSKLTSGYFGGQDRSKPIELSKCSHGGNFDSSATVLLIEKASFRQGINKDTKDCFLSPHSNLHSEAIRLAKMGTRQFIENVETAITPEQFRLLLGIGPNLIIAIDTTSSMGNIIDQVKSQAIEIVRSRIGRNDEPSKYVLAPFNDPRVGPVTSTTNPDIFVSAISNLIAQSDSDNTDCPELSMTGTFQGLAAADKGGDLFLFTDDAAKDANMADQVIATAKMKGIRIFPEIFPSVASQCSSNTDPIYWRIAKESGAPAFSLKRDEAGSIARFANLVVRSNAINILSVADGMPSSISAESFISLDKVYNVPVDTTMTNVVFSVSGTSQVLVKRPDGTIVRSLDTGVTFVPLSNGAIYSVDFPSAGSWSVVVSGSGNFFLDVSGDSKLFVSRFDFIEPGGRPGHEGVFPLIGKPLTGQMNQVVAQLTRDFSNVQFELRGKSGILIQTLSLTRDTSTTPNRFIGEVILPKTPFLVYMTGTDANGIKYQRAIPSMVDTQTIKIDPPAPEDLHSGQATNYIFRVTNFGPTGTFRLSGADDKGYLRSINPSILTLGANESKDVVVVLQPPAESPIGISDTLTITVQSTGSDGANNYAVVTSSVVGGGQADIGISNTASLNQVTNGSPLTYTVTVKNNGPNPASSVLVTDNLPKAASYIFCSATQGGVCAGSGNNRVVSFPSLASGASATITFVTSVNCAEINGATLSNTATVAANTTDPNPANNTATATVAVAPGQVKVTPESGVATLQFGPITAMRDPNLNSPSRTITLENTGCLPVSVNLSIKRTGTDVTSGKIINPDDGAIFPLFVVNPNGSETAVTTGLGTPSLQLPGGQKQTFRLRFQPLIPILSGKISGLFANQAIPDVITSQLVITPDAGAPTTVNLTARVATPVQLIHPTDSRLSPLIVFTRSGVEYTVECSAHDPNLDMYLARYQFLDQNDRAVGLPADVDLAQPITQRGLVRGQSFTIIQKFAGSLQSNVAKVQITLYDRETNVVSAKVSLGAGEPLLTNVSAASYLVSGLATESMTAAFGASLASNVQTATTIPLPTTLIGTSVRVRDGSGIERLAPLFFVSPNQVNYQIPPGTRVGAATVSIQRSEQTVAREVVQVAAAAPALFSANSSGQGVAAAVALRVMANGSQRFDPIVRFDQARNQFVSIPVTFGQSSEQLFLVLFGAGIRFRNPQGSISAKVGGVDVQVIYAGAQGGFVGMDQVNILLPRSLAGRGEVDVVVLIDGKLSNVVKVNLGGTNGLMYLNDWLAVAARNEVVSPVNQAIQVSGATELPILHLPTLKLPSRTRNFNRRMATGQKEKQR